MRVSVELSKSFGPEWDQKLQSAAREMGWLEADEDLTQTRFLSRSVIPHVIRLSDHFNRKSDFALPFERNYFRESSHPAHFRLAYCSAYLPGNAFRVAAVWEELRRRGWPGLTAESPRAIELGSGPGSAALGIWMAESARGTDPETLRSWQWNWVDRDRGLLDFGVKLQSELGAPWGVRTFHRPIDLKKQPVFPLTMPKMDLWTSSFFLNELGLEPAALARSMDALWKRHLASPGIVILTEPALRIESRKLLRFREELIKLWAERGEKDFRILLPCMGHQACGALTKETDWCHEEALWWRPPSMKKIDDLTGLDHRRLPFSYLVIARGAELPNWGDTHRIVSDVSKAGPDWDFFTCGADGKRRTRWSRAEAEKRSSEDVERGELFTDATFAGSPEASRMKLGRK